MAKKDEKAEVRSNIQVGVRVLLALIMLTLIVGFVLAVFRAVS